MPFVRQTKANFVIFGGFVYILAVTLVGLVMTSKKDSFCQMMIDDDDDD